MLGSCENNVYHSLTQGRLFLLICIKKHLIKIDIRLVLLILLFLLLTSVPPTLTLSGSESKSNIKLECTAPTQALQDTQ